MLSRDCVAPLCSLDGDRCSLHSRKGVRVVANEAQRRVDITIDGQPFTSYIWPTSLKKPVLYPLITDDGITVTRGYPLEPRPGERVDHPHHAGLWFNYGDVNGFDFWNNSDAIKPEDRAQDGLDRADEDRFDEERRRSRRTGGRIDLGDGRGQADSRRRRRATSSRGSAHARVIDRSGHAEGARSGRVSRRQGRRAGPARGELARVAR